MEDSFFPQPPEMLMKNWCQAELGLPLETTIIFIKGGFQIRPYQG